MSRKSVSFGQLVKYINEPQNKSEKAVFHNLLIPKDSQKAIERQFLINWRYMEKRKNGIVLYHDILSFSELDKNYLTPEVMIDIASEYLKYRAKDALGYAKCHFDTSNPHIHFMISGNLIKSRRKLRFSRIEFSRTKKKTEQYQKNTYPQLSHSIVFDQSKEKQIPESKQTYKESELSRRFKKEGKGLKANKEQIKAIISDCMAQSFDFEEFTACLNKAGLEFYRRGKNAGVKHIDTDRKYRFKRLGVHDEFLESEKRWNKRIERGKRLDAIEISKIRSKWQDLGFKNKIMNILRDKFDKPSISK